MSAALTIAVRGTDLLGESPVWDEREGALYWVDIRAGRLRRWHPATGALAAQQLDDLACFVALGPAPGRLLVGTRKAIGWVEFGRPGLTPLVEIEPDLPRNRLNEARVDPHGGLLFGTMLDGDRQPVGALYRLTAQGAPTRLLDGVTVPNSIAWSPDGGTLYFADTWRHTIWRLDYRADGIVPGSRLVFVDLTASGGRPDGSAVDTEGCLWNAQPGTARVVRYRPDGSEDRIVQLPARDVTAVCFGGDDLSTLFVTSATQKLTEAERLAQPAAGSVFALRCAVPGLPTPKVRWEGAFPAAGG